MRVLYLIDTLEVGGSEQSLLQILQNFTTVQPLVCHIYRGETLRPDYERKGIEVVSLNCGGRYDFFYALQKVLEIVHHYRPCIIHTTLFRADIIGRLAGVLSGIPVVSTFVNDAYHADRLKNLSMLALIKLRLVQLTDQVTARFATHFIAVSQATGTNNCRALHISPKKVLVIYRGRDTKPFLDVSSQPLFRLREELDIPAEAKILVNVARILQRKGQEELIRAMPAVLEEFPHTHLLLVGDGHYRPTIEHTIDKHNMQNAVHLLGVRTDVPVLLKSADLFVFPSHYEGHPGSLVEAMLAACPIVASDIPVHREMIQQGENGMLFSVTDHDALAQTIIYLLKSPEQASHMGQKAQVGAMAKFDIKRIAQQHENLYTSLCKGSTGKL